MRTILLLIVLCDFLLLVGCRGAETKPVKNNVLKEYVKTPLDKAKGMKVEVEARQDKAKDMLNAVDD